jgi:hypothetical protein
VDTATLVEDQIEEGHRLLEQLRRSRFPVSVACWLLNSYDEAWYIYVASPIVESDGLLDAHMKLSTELSKGNLRSPLLSNIRLISDRDPIAQEATIYQQDREIFHYQGRTLGRLIVDEAYIYPKG